jgi:hypothetical protein
MQKGRGPLKKEDSDAPPHGHRQPGALPPDTPDHPPERGRVARQTRHAGMRLAKYRM